MWTEEGSALIYFCLRDQPQVQFVLFLGEIPRQKRCHTLRAAAAKVRNQQKNLWAWIRGQGVILEI